MSYRDDRNPPPEPKPPTLEDLATALAATNKRVTVLMICLFALLGLIILLVGLAKVSSRPAVAPVASLTTSQTAQLQELSARINQATARADSALAKAANAEAASLNSVTLTESFGSRVDEVNKTLNGLYINGTLPPKK